MPGEKRIYIYMYVYTPPHTVWANEITQWEALAMKSDNLNSVPGTHKERTDSCKLSSALYTHTVIHVYTHIHKHAHT